MLCVVCPFSRSSQCCCSLRIYLDPREVDRMPLNGQHPFVKLSRMRNVEIKLKASADR